MYQAQFSIPIEKVNKQTSIIRIQGEFTVAAEYVLKKAYEECSSAGASVIILDLHDMQYMNSYGIGLLIRMLIQCKSRNQRLIAYGLSWHYQRIFLETRLDEVIRILPGEREALAAARSN